MTDDTADRQVEINSTILDINKSLEDIWESILIISNALSLEKIQSNSIKKLLTYNPHNPSAFKIIPQYKEPMKRISVCIKKCLDSLTTQNQNEASVWALLGKLYCMTSDFPNAYSSFAHVLRIDKEYDDPIFWFLIGCVYQHFDFNKQAREFFLKVSDRRIKDMSDYKLRLALSSRVVGEFEEAKSLLESIVDSPPLGLKSDDIRFQIYYTCQCMGDLDYAVKGYKSLCDKYPNNLQIVHQWLWSLSFTPNYKVAKSYIHENGLVDPTSKFFLARIELLEQQLESSYRLLAECLQYCSEWPIFWCHLGSLYYLNQQQKDACVAYQRALYLNNDIEEAWLNLAATYEEGKSFDGAKKILETGRLHCSHNTKINERLEYLKKSTDPKKYDLAGSFPREITQIRYHVQEADKHLETIFNTPPIMENIDFCNNKSVTSDCISILQPYTSLFAN